MVLLELWHETQCSSRVGTCISVDFLSCIKGVKYTFAFQEGTWYSSLDTTLEKGLISHRGGNLLVFLELQQEAWGSFQVAKGTSWTCLCCLGEVRYFFTLQGARRDSSPIPTGK